MEQLYNQKVLNVNNIFTEHFIDAKNLYLHSFNKLPSLNYLNGINGEKAFEAVREKYAGLVQEVHTYQWYKRNRKKYQFDTTIVLLSNRCILEFDEGWCTIMHDGRQQEFVTDVTEMANSFKQRHRRQPLEINVVTHSRGRLELRPLEIKRTNLDLDLYYEDSFLGTDAIIKARLKRSNDKGIVLLHGLPGTGKTTYLRYLIGRIKKRILFLSPGVAGNLMNPEFIQLLIEHPNTVVIIEDAENIIMDRRANESSAVSNLLNISDGLLADCLSVQLICTFNSSVALVDKALLRKGRLIAAYEFGKLSVEKARLLSAHLGHETEINQPMTIAEIANPGERTVEMPRTEILGFRGHKVWEQ